MRNWEDRRPTLASWPKRIYEWEELPPVFRPALEVWRAQGLPMEHITYIPQVRQYADCPEYATAWFGNELLLQTAQRNRVTVRRVTSADVMQTRYQVRLLRCDVTIFLKNGGELAFSYNKTKEDQLFPVLNLLLGNPPDFIPAKVHPADADWERLLKDSYAMYYTSQLCYYFGGTIHSHLWFRGKTQNLLYILRKMPPPEYFLAVMDRGLAVLVKDFYETRATFLPWKELHLTPPDDGEPVFRIVSDHGESPVLPLLPGQAAQIREFLRHVSN